MTAPTALRALLNDVVGPDVGIGVTNPCRPSSDLWPQEANAIGKAVSARQLEFAAGRAAARQAMAELDHPACAIPMGRDRAPIWPEKLSGSIAHSKSICIAAVTLSERRKTLGIDVEETSALDAELWDIVLTSMELSWISRQLESERGKRALQIFSAKEAVYKAQYPQTERVLEFQDVDVSFESESFSAEFFGRMANGRQIASGGYIFSFVALPVLP